MIAFCVLPIAMTLFGAGVLAFASRGLNVVERVAAGAIIGPSLMTLVFFLGMQAGIPCSEGNVLSVGFAWTLVVLGVVVGASGLRRPSEKTPRSAYLPAMIAFATLFFTVVRALERATPVWDGIGLSAMKARFFLGTGGPWRLLHDTRYTALHLDYPLHVPLGMDLGSLIEGTSSGVACLAADLLALPAVVLLVGVMAARHCALSGVIASALLAIVPIAHTYSATGYGDVPLMALVTLALLMLTQQPRFMAAAIAAGLLTWVKLEGAVLFGLFSIAAVSVASLRKQVPFRPACAAIGLAAVWPVTLLLSGIAMGVAENEAAVNSAVRRDAIIEGFFLTILKQNGFCSLLLAGCLGAIYGIATRRERVVAYFFLGALAMYPILAFVRHTSPEYLAGDVPKRLLLQILPLGIYLAATQCLAPRRGARHDATQGY